MKKVASYKGWKLYQYTEKEAKEMKENVGDTIFAFLPNESPTNFDSPEWEDGSIEAVKRFIDSYKKG